MGDDDVGVLPERLFHGLPQGYGMDLGAQSASQGGGYGKAG